MKIVDMSHVMNVHTPGWVGYAGNKMYYAQNLQTADDRGAAHRHRAACRHPFRRRDARHRQPQGRHGVICRSTIWSTAAWWSTSPGK